MLNLTPNIVCIRVQWNHPDLSGCAPRVGVGWAIARKLGVAHWVESGLLDWIYGLKKVGAKD